jgi:transposase-like protein
MSEGLMCPKCGGRSTKKGFLLTRHGWIQRYQCQTCSKQFSGPLQSQDKVNVDVP